MVASTSHTLVEPSESTQSKSAHLRIDKPSGKLAPAPFTIKEVRDVIPARYFQRSGLEASKYLAVDLLACSVLFSAATLLAYTPLYAQLVLWPTYWFLQGLIMTGVWVIGHECGHQSFSESRALNFSVGLVLHSLLLVPFHSWRITHGMHHKNTSHMERDQVFVPSTRSKAITSTVEAAKESPLGTLIGLFLMSLIGWPGYLLFNASGQDYGRRTNHFEPSSPVFKPNQRFDVILSDLGLLAAFGLFGFLSYTFSFTAVMMYYFIPYLWTNFWLVSITFLQHTDVRVPHYRGEEWNFIRGALATVDRDFGVLNTVFHNITDSHVAHHLFSTMPHFHAIEATKYLKEFLGKYYLYDDSPMLPALWSSWRACQFVEDEGEIIYYKSATCGNL